MTTKLLTDGALAEALSALMLPFTLGAIPVSTSGAVSRPPTGAAT